MKRPVLAVMIVVLLAVVAAFWLTRIPTGMVVGSDTDNVTKQVSEITSFAKVEGPACEVNGKPVIRMFSTTWCPHCKWIKSTFDSVVKEYEDRIVAHHWEVDINDDTLTQMHEGYIPRQELDVFRRFNPRGSVPTFVFGCKYYRIGNAYETENDLSAEAAEFRAVIEELLKSE